MIDVPEGHHDLSHHGNDAKKLEKIAKINTFHMEQFAYLLGKLKAVKEGERHALLDNVDDRLRQRHRRRQPPQPRRPADPARRARAAARSRAAGTSSTRSAADTPLTNLFLALFERMGAPGQRFGDSTGVLKI